MQRTSSMRSDTDVSTSGSQSLAKPGSTPFTNSDAPPSSGRLLDRVGQLRRHGAVRVLQEHRAARDDVDAGGEEPLEIVDRLEQPVVGHRGVHDAVRLEREQRVGVVRRGDAEVAVEPGQLAGVLADLGRIGDPDADELELGTGVDAGDRVPPDVAGAPLHDRIVMTAHRTGPGSGGPCWASAARRGRRGPRR